MPPSVELEVDAGRQVVAAPRLADADGAEADVVGVLQAGDPAAAVEGDVELAREAVQLAVVEDVVVHLLGQRAASRSAPADRCRWWGWR